MEFLIKLFEQLKKNKQFPKYQLERRVDIFINIFLAEILTQYFNDGTKVQYICPEFPIKKAGNRQSTNVDYLCLKELSGEMELIFIELKTDEHSFDKEQLEIYMNNRIWKTLRENIHDLSESKKYKAKYDFLIKRLNEKSIPLNALIRILYISPINIKNKIVEKGYTVINDNVKSVSTLLNSSMIFNAEAKIVADLIKDWNLCVFEISD